MSSSFVPDALRTLRVVPDGRDGRLESRSGAGVHRVRTAGGAAAFVKLVPSALGPDALAAARRELRFYRELAPAAPIRTPAMLDHLDTDDGVVLLLAAAGEPVDVRAWTPGMWAALGRDLAALHGMPGHEWARPDSLGAAMAHPDLPAITAFWGPALPGLDEILSAAHRLTAAVSASPPGFVHGDCHTMNITVADGTLVFCDWQSAGAGRASADLAFLSVRAVPAGVRVPSALLDAYLEARPGRPAELRRATAAEELATLVFQWPRFARYNSPAGIARVRARARQLAAGLATGR